MKMANGRNVRQIKGEDLSSEVSSIYSGFSVRLLRFGDIVSLNIRTSSTNITGTGAWVTLCNIPESVRPSNAIDLLAINNSASSQQTIALQFRINTNGNVAVYLYSGASTRPMGQLTFNCKI